MIEQRTYVHLPGACNYIMDLLSVSWYLLPYRHMVLPAVIQQQAAVVVQLGKSMTSPSGA